MKILERGKQYRNKKTDALLFEFSMELQLHLKLKNLSIRSK